VSAFQQAYDRWATLDRRWSYPLDIRVMRIFHGPGKPQPTDTQVRLLRARLQLRRERLAARLADAQAYLDEVWHRATIRPLGFDEQKAVSNAIGHDWAAVFVTNVVIAMCRHSGLDISRDEAEYLADTMVDAAPHVMGTDEARQLIELRRRHG
jgi:hypothetical protein